VNQLIKIGARAKMAFPVHVHMLRHALRLRPRQAGHDTRTWATATSSTPRAYTELAPELRKR
jgi:hypothetical protein